MERGGQVGHGKVGLRAFAGRLAVVLRRKLQQPVPSEDQRAAGREALGQLAEAVGKIHGLALRPRRFTGKSSVRRSGAAKRPRLEAPLRGPRMLSASNPPGLRSRPAPSRGAPPTTRGLPET